MPRSPLTLMPDNFPLVRQFDASDCGAACLTMITRHYGLPLTLSDLRERVATGEEGASLMELHRAASETGFEARAVYADYDILLNKLRLPVILHWRSNHWVVVYRVTKREVAFADPAVGKMVLPREQFEQNWLIAEGENAGFGRVLALFPSEVLQQAVRTAVPERPAPLRRILQLAGDYRGLLGQIGVALILNFIFLLSLPFLLRALVDTGIRSQIDQHIYVIGMAIGMMLLGYYLVRSIRAKLVRYVGSRVNLRLFTDFLRRLTDLPISFFTNRFSNDVLNRLEDSEEVENFFSRQLLNALFSVLQLLVVGVVLFIFDWKLATIYLITTLIYFLVVRYFQVRAQTLHRTRLQEADDTSYLLDEMVRGMPDLKINGAVASRRRRWEENRARQANLFDRYAATERRQVIGAGAIGDVRNFVITFVAAVAAVEGSISLGTLLAVQYMLGQLSEPSARLLYFQQRLQDIKLSLDRMEDVYLREEQAGGSEPLPDSGTLSLDGVHFTYPGTEQQVLTDINLQIPEGTTLAIVGQSGSGKTTLLKILMGILEASHGTARMGDTPIRDIQRDTWYRHLGAVLQDGFLFTDTLARNIALEDEEPDEERVRLVLERVQLAREVDQMPDGMYTRIGPWGRSLSQGQKQRVLLARALYRQPYFLFLDEATNALDTRNESAITRELNHFLSGRTAVIVAHRLNTVMHADQIVVLDEGQIVERGTHQELVRRRGAYWELVRAQLEL